MRLRGRGERPPPAAPAVPNPGLRAAHEPANRSSTGFGRSGETTEGTRLRRSWWPISTRGSNRGRSSSIGPARLREELPCAAQLCEQPSAPGLGRCGPRVRRQRPPHRRGHRLGRRRRDRQARPGPPRRRGRPGLHPGARRSVVRPGAGSLQETRCRSSRDGSASWAPSIDRTGDHPGSPCHVRRRQPRDPSTHERIVRHRPCGGDNDLTAGGPRRAAFCRISRISCRPARRSAGHSGELIGQVHRLRLMGGWTRST